jgi:hypothetical protein
MFVFKFHPPAGRLLFASLCAVALLVCAQVAHAGSIILVSTTGASGSWVAVATGGSSGAGSVGDINLTLSNGDTISGSVIMSSTSPGNATSANIQSVSLAITSSGSGTGTGTLYVALGSQGFTAPSVGPLLETTTMTTVTSSGVTGSTNSYINTSNVAPTNGGSNAWQQATYQILNVTSGSGASLAIGSLGTPYAIDQQITLSIAENGSGSFATETLITPEPASMTMLAIGALGMLGYGWRRRRQAGRLEEFASVA